MVKDNIKQYSILIIVLLLNSFQTVSAQKKGKQDNYRPLDKIALKIKNQYSSEQDKAFAIYEFVIKNIKYDVKSYQEGSLKAQSPPVTYKKKKGVCSHYAELYHYLAKEIGLQSKVIVGYSKGTNYFYGKKYLRGDHAWNVVRIDGEWYLLDATWGAGSVTKKKQSINSMLYQTLKIPYNRNKYKFIKAPRNAFFKTDPKLFIQTHIPVDPRFQLLSPIVPIEVFEDYDTVLTEFIKSPTGEPYDYRDSIADFFDTKVENQLLKEGFSAHRYNYKNYFYIGNREANYGLSKVRSSNALRGTNTETRIYFSEVGRGHLQEAIYYLKEDQKHIIGYHNYLKEQQKIRHEIQLGLLKKVRKQNERRLDKNPKYIGKGKDNKKALKERIKLMHESILSLESEDKLSRIKEKALPENAELLIAQIEYFIDSLNISTQVALTQNDSLFYNGNKSLNHEMNVNRKYIDSLSLKIHPSLEHYNFLKKQMSLNTVLKEDSIFEIIQFIEDEKISLINQNYEKRTLIDQHNGAALKGNYKQIKKNIKQNQKYYKRLIQLGKNKEELLANYEQDKDTLIAHMNFMINVYQDYINSNQINQVMIKTEQKILKMENKRLNKSIDTENIYYDFIKKEEKLRYSIEQKDNNYNLVQTKKWLKLSEKNIAKLKRILTEQDNQKKIY